MVPDKGSLAGKLSSANVKPWKSSSTTRRRPLNRFRSKKSAYDTPTATSGARGDGYLHFVKSEDFLEWKHGINDRT